MLFEAYCRHNLLPGDIYNLPKGQKTFTLVCQALELEREAKKANGH